MTTIVPFTITGIYCTLRTMLDQFEVVENTTEVRHPFMSFNSALVRFNELNEWPSYKGKLLIKYTNYRNQISQRVIYPIRLSFENTAWHGWTHTLYAYDFEKEAFRSFDFTKVIIQTSEN